MSLKIAILDDYAEVARSFADWPAEDEIQVFTRTITDPAELIRQLEPFDVICVMRERTPLPATILNALPRLKLIITSGARNLSIDVAAAEARGIPVCGTDSRASATAEFIMALILALTRRIVPEANSASAGGWQVGMGRDLAGLTLGIAGFGRLGRKVAELARPFGVEIAAWSRSLTPEAAAAAGVRHAPDLGELLSISDIVSVNLVLADGTRGMFGAEEFARMKPDAAFVNTSRGPIVHTGALLAALREGRLGSAAIDVYDVEPLQQDAEILDQDLIRAGRLLLTPHLGYVSEQTFRTFYQQMVEAIAAWKAGAPIRRLSAVQTTPKN